jgi:hypothetical protein
MILLMEPFQQIALEHERCLDQNHPHHIPWGSSLGWALHIRRTRPMLELSIQRSHRIFPLVDPGAKWNENKATWTFSSGYKYQFGHCHDSEDWQNYLSFEYSIILYDELVQMEEEQYDQINTRLRSSDPLLRKMLKVRSMSNPLMSKQKGDNFSIKDPNWVRKRFVDPAPEGKTTLKKQIRMQDGSIREHTTVYLPATLYDNPDPEFVKIYEFQLQKSKPHIRQALLYGNWYITAGSYYGDVWNRNLHVCRPFKIPKEWPKWRSMDWGFKMPGCIHWWAMDEDMNVYCFREMNFQGMQATAVAQAIKQIEDGYGLVKNGKSILTGPADTQLWEDRGDSTKGKAQEMADEGVNWVRATKGPGSRLRNAELLYERLADHQSGTTTPGVVFFEGCAEAIKLIPAMGTSDKNSEEPADGNDDHAVDSCVVAGTVVTTPDGQKPIEELCYGEQVLSTDGRYWTCLGGRLTRKQADVVRLIFDGGEIVATPDHRVLCTDGQWRRIDQLDTSCYVFSPWDQSALAEPSRNLREFGTIYAANTSSETELGSIERYGSEKMAAPSRTGIMSTTWMRTGLTTRLTTSFCCWAPSIAESIRRSETLKSCGNWLRSVGNTLRRGTEVLKVALGTRSTQRSPFSNPFQLCLASAEFAGTNLWIALGREGSGAPEPVHRSTAGKSEPTRSSEYALPAGSNSWPSGSSVSPPVHGVAAKVIAIETVGKADVYCTSVPGMGAFVANGIVVSNCFYSMGYASHGRAGLGWRSADSDDVSDEKEKPKGKRGRWGYGSQVM